jgi:hypothetical protein
VIDLYSIAGTHFTTNGRADWDDDGGDDDDYADHAHPIPAARCLSLLDVAVFVGNVRLVKMLSSLSVPFQHVYELAKLAVQQNVGALEFASEELRADRELVKLAVQQGGYALQYASEELRADRELVKLAVQQGGYALE